MSGSLKACATQRSPHRPVYQNPYSLLGACLVGLCLSQITVSHALSQAIEPAGSTLTASSLETTARPVLKIGSRGDTVSELQATLKLLGYYNGAVDGIYGQSTASAVAQFQQAAGLQTDGVVGAATWNRLFPPTPGVPNANQPGGTTASGFPVPSTNQPPPKPAASGGNPPATPPAINTTKKPPPTAESPRPNSPSNEPVTLPVLRRGMRGPAVISLQERLRTIGVFQGAADGVFGEETQAAVKSAQRRFNLDPDGVVGPATWNALLQ